MRTTTTRYSSNNNQQGLITSSQSKVVYSNFINAIKSPETKEKYSYNFLKYTEYLNIERDNISDLLNHDVKTIEKDIIAYIMNMKDEKGYSYSSMKVRLSSIFLFFDMNDIIINKKKIKRYLGEHTKTVKDRAYTRKEIKKIVDACNLKYKIVVTLMASSGCRIGAIPKLRLSALKYIENYQLYQVTFYEHSKKDAYYSFTTPECANYINEYLEYRKRCGEQLNDKSPLIRDDFIIDDLLHIENPRSLALVGYVVHLRNILIKTGLRTIATTDESDKTAWNRQRKEVSANHGFRKFCHTVMANAKINIEIREMMLGHSIGLGDAYYRPTTEQCLLEYLKVVDELTINEENRLTKQVQELKQQDDYNRYLIDKKIKDLTSKVEEYEEIQKEGRIISREQSQKFADIYEKVQVLFAKIDKEKEENRDYEKTSFDDLDAKDQKFEKFLKTRRERIKQEKL